MNDNCLDSKTRSLHQKTPKSASKSCFVIEEIIENNQETLS